MSDPPLLSPAHLRLLRVGLGLVVLLWLLVGVASAIPFVVVASIAYAVWANQPEIIATTPLILDASTVLEVEVPPGVPIGLDVTLVTLPFGEDPWALAGGIDIDGVHFPVRVTSDAPAVTGLWRGYDRWQQEPLEPGGRRWVGASWLGTIPPADEPRTVRVTLELAAEGDILLDRAELRARVQ